MRDDDHVYDPVHVIVAETMLGTRSYIYTDARSWPNMVEQYDECAFCGGTEDAPAHIH